MTGHSDLESYLLHANSVILHTSESADAPPVTPPPKTPLKIGVDLGTAYLMVVVLGAENIPLAGEWRFAQVARDGLIVDFMGAVDLLKGMKHRLERRLGCELPELLPGVLREDTRWLKFGQLPMCWKQPDFNAQT